MMKSKKKIIYIVTKANWGGAQKYVFDLATALYQEKYDVSVIHGQGNILNKRLEKEEIRTIPVSIMGRDYNIFSEIFIFFKLIIIFLKERPDIVHLNSSKAGGLGALSARLAFVPKIIFTVHGWAFNEPQYNNLLTRFLSWLTVFLTTKTIVISKGDFEQAKRFPFFKDKFIFIHNGIKNIFFKDRNSSRKFISDITKTPIQKPWVVTISELHKNKGLEYLIKAVHKMSKKPIVFVLGEGEERDHLEKLVESLGLKENFYLMGFVENASSYLKAFDVFTMTSIKEGHPYAILEAGLAELPVLASNIQGITDILDDKTGVLVEKENPDDIAEKLEGLFADKRKTAQLGRNLREKINKEFSFSKTLEKTTSIY